MTDQMKPHLHGLSGRAADALDDAELVFNDPQSSPDQRRWALLHAAAMVDALRAEHDDEDNPNV
jgi:hypothetical protein